jgi:hypothetical protein
VTRQRVADAVRAAFPTLPSNVALIPAESRLDSYGLVPHLGAATVYGSQFGLELACRGLPVVVVSACFYARKGFTRDVESPREYFALLERLDRIEPLDHEARDRARRYAYHVYFRRLVPFRYLVNRDWSQMRDLCLDGLEELLPGRDPFLDRILEGVVDGRPVVLDHA